ncbi:hypothetical protein BGW36DRAFT_372132 [Talaromyces proteolyticus]|uniref:NADH dehydrogenase [ubiquinone] 1 alpha subcomplex subunit n=1 Tax=Talaromyces proteolyticus TaxID=1131652 RepID=A0AAD4PYZ1_9EURO|nr:uncharacterized protein BGW36DRAFT_372132 [Talaromyces proteolyticus]KAH8702065.1 hypothetical protein BGW36DRAFT_372132 [Talaromyces proteolyticus]
MSPINSLWFRWKALKLPWRRSWVVGQDLYGNTFWEFKDALNANRLRRIVRYNKNAHLGDVKISPQWHQWLRYVRNGPPSIEEQRRDLAQIADERWAAKPSFLDKPQTQSTRPATGTRDPATRATEPQRRDRNVQPADDNNIRSETPTQEKLTKEKEKGPWAKVPTGPGETWQPEAWTPDAVKR